MTIYIKNENRKSLNKNSQIRDLPLLPLSNSEDTRNPQPGGRCRGHKKIEFGIGCARRATYEGFRSEARSEERPTYSPSVKEVIQPQVPLRLPCYDFAPVTALAFGRLVLAVPTRTSGAHSFHGVTGGVYKARERIHRGVADPRLLAIPASWRRVAASNPH